MSDRSRLCEQCAQPFRPPHANGRFCSRECLSEHRVGVPEVQAALQQLGVPLRALVAA